MENVINSEKLNLIVLTDFSVAADNATHFTQDFAKALSANVFLLHIWENSILNPDYFIKSHPYNSEKKIESALQQRRLEFDASLEVKTAILKGTITDKLPKFLKNTPNSLVIIGKRFTENMPDEMVSSTSIQLLDIEGISLLIIPERFETINLPKKIGFGWDGQGFSLKSKIFAHLFNALKAELIVVHVSKEEENLDTDNYLEITQELLGIDSATATLDVTESDTVVSKIRARSAINEVDLQTFIIRKRPFLNQLFHASVSADFIRHATLPLLILHG